jgi:hypothetical protein
MLRVAVTHRIEEFWCVAKITEEVGAQICCLGHSTAPVDGSRADLSSAQQTSDRSNRVASSQNSARAFFEQRRYFLVRSNSRLGEMPGATLGPIRELLGQHRMDAATLIAGRQLHHTAVSVQGRGVWPAWVMGGRVGDETATA